MGDEHTQPSQKDNHEHVSAEKIAPQKLFILFVCAGTEHGWHGFSGLHLFTRDNLLFFGGALRDDRASIQRCAVKYAGTLCDL